MSHPNRTYRTYRAADVLFRLGGAFAVTWIYLRTLLVRGVGVDPTAWQIFAWTGWPFVLVMWIGAILTLRSWLKER